MGGRPTEIQPEFVSLKRNSHLAQREGHDQKKAWISKRAETLSARPVIGGIFVLQPFILAKTAYVSMTDLQAEWVVIAKYDKTNELQDVCYFESSASQR